MKKLLVVILAVCFCALPILASEIHGEQTDPVFAVTYVGGEGEAHYPTLVEATRHLLPSGGTVVVTVPYSNTASVQLADVPMTITSVYGNVDYRTTAGASLGVGRINLNADTVIDGIKLIQTLSSNGNINCNGHRLTVGADVVCEPYGGTGTNYTNILGGAGVSLTSPVTDVTVNGGTWGYIYGGSYQTDTDAATNVVINGGEVKKAVVACTIYGAFDGTANVTVNGGVVAAVAGGSHGNVNSARTTNGSMRVTVTGGTVTDVFAGSLANNKFQGNSDVVISGGTVTNVWAGSASNCSVYGGTASSNMVFEGTASVTIQGSAVVTNVYGVSRAGTHTGTSSVHIAGGTVTNVYGSNADGSCGASPVTVSGGTVSNVYGGCYSGTLSADTSVTMTGGSVTNLLQGGSRCGTFTGNASVDVSGGHVYQIVGGIYGVSGSASSITGDISVLVHGDAEIERNVFAVSYRNNVTAAGDVTVDIYEDAQLYRYVYGGPYAGTLTTGTGGVAVTIRGDTVFHKPSGANTLIIGGSYSGTVTGDIRVTVADRAYIPGNVYAGGYQGTVEGNTYATITGGEVKILFSSGSRTGTVTGDSTSEALGGKIGYNTEDEVYGIRTSGNYTDETTHGTVEGNGYIILDGADVAGSIELGYTSGGLITLKSGRFGSSADEAVIDLSQGGTLYAGGNVAASALNGGGTLSLTAAAKVTAAAFAGNITLDVTGGTPVHNTAYLTVTDLSSGGTVTYTGSGMSVARVEEEGVINFRLRYDGRYDKVGVKITYYNSGTSSQIPHVLVFRGVNTDTGKTAVSFVSGTENGRQTASFQADPGLYFAQVFYGSTPGSNYYLRYFYISGEQASYDMEMPFEPYVSNSYMETISLRTTDQVRNAWLGTAGLINYEAPETPTFTDPAVMARRAFLTNAEICAYADELASSSPYCYVFYPFALSPMGNRCPVLVFTKDDIPDGADFYETARIVRGGGVREIFMISGGVHGNEPTGPEGTLSFGQRLTTSYGTALIDKFGAIVIIPVVSLDNSQRFTRNTTDNINPNRNFIANSIYSSNHLTAVYSAFMPTAFVDCHEDYSRLTPDEGDYSIGGMAFEDVNFNFNNNRNSPISNPGNYIDGMDPAVLLATPQYQILQNCITGTAERTGLRSGIYYSNAPNPGISQSYASIRGSYGYLIETMRILASKESRYERSVYAMTEALKSLAEQIASYDGQLARNVYENRERMKATTKYDPDNVFALAQSASGETVMTSPSVSVYPDGTLKDGSGIKTLRIIDTVTQFRPLPTAYVIDANEPSISDVLSRLDAHGIGYTRLAAGSTLTLRKYSGTYSDVTIGSAQSVTFANGAYAVTLNTSDAYLIAYLFEPDSYAYNSEQETTISFAHQGFFPGSGGWYRSEVDDVYLLIESMDADRPAAGIKAASLELGSDISVRYLVSINDPGAISGGTLMMRFQMHGMTTDVTGYTALGDYAVFTFKAIAPQYMSENISAILYLDEGGTLTELSSRDVFSIKAYAQALIGAAGTPDDVKRLASDLLYYGAAAQEYRGYGLRNIASSNVCGILSESEMLPLSTDVQLSEKTGDVYFRAAGVRFDYVNSLYVLLSKTDNVRLCVKKNGTLEGEYSHLTSDTFYTQGIGVTRFDDIYTFELYDGETLVQTLRYSVKSYVYAMKDKTGEQAAMAALARALYTYGASACALAE